MYRVCKHAQPCSRLPVREQKVLAIVRLACWLVCWCIHTAASNRTRDSLVLPEHRHLHQPAVQLPLPLPLRKAAELRPAAVSCVGSDA